MLALLMAPLAMLAPQPAMAHSSGHAASSPADCPSMKGEKQTAPDGGVPGMAIDCAIACACIPSAQAPMQGPSFLPGLFPTDGIPLAIAGLDPEAEPRPPRHS